jgi:hypothetical protein
VAGSWWQSRSARPVAERRGSRGRGSGEEVAATAERTGGGGLVERKWCLWMRSVPEFGGTS